MEMLRNDIESNSKRCFFLSVPEDSRGRDIAEEIKKLNVAKGIVVVEAFKIVVTFTGYSRC
jgi:hypothetical protein